MTEKRITTDSMEMTSAIFGSYDVNVRLIESHFGVTVTNRDGSGGDAGTSIVVRGENEDAVGWAARLCFISKKWQRPTER